MNLTLHEANRRVETRFLIDLPQVLIETNSHCEYVQMINVARLGFLAKTRCFYRTDERVLLLLPGLGPVKSTIIWCQNNMVGGKFLSPLDMDALTRTEQGNGAVSLKEI